MQFLNAYFLLEWIEFDFELPFEIMDGLILRKCTTSEEEHLMKFWKDSSTSYIGAYKYHCKEGSTTSNVHREERDKYRYWYLDFEMEKIKKFFLQYSFSLCEFSLNIGLEAIGQTGKRTSLWHEDPKLYNYFQDEDNIYLTKLSKSNFEEAKYYYEQIESLDQIKFGNILEALKRFEETKLLLNKVKFKVLSYFTIIEGLLTHNPIDPTNVDSITRQITSKVILLNKRLDKQIDLKIWFGDINERKLFSKLYAYRSAIAHGLKIDFAGDFQIFKNEMHVLKFIKELAKSILRASLKEPQLINDLKEC